MSFWFFLALCKTLFDDGRPPRLKRYIVRGPWSFEANSFFRSVAYPCKTNRTHIVGNNDNDRRTAIYRDGWNIKFCLSPRLDEQRSRSHRNNNNNNSFYRKFYYDGHRAVGIIEPYNNNNYLTTANVVLCARNNSLFLWISFK